MTPERVAALVARWVRFYTRDLPSSVAARRVDEIAADVYDHMAHDRAVGTSDRRIAISILSRMVRGIPADMTWRDQHASETTDRLPAHGGPMFTQKVAFRTAVVVGLGAMLALVWGVAAMGLIGAEGDPFDLLYIAVLAVGIVGSAVVRFEPAGMVRVLLAMAAAQALVAAIALAMGKQDVPVSSVAEIVGLNAFFAAWFVASAWLFQQAARRAY